MSKVLERLKKKRGHSLTIGDETFYVRAMTIGEFRRSDSLKPEERTGFLIGCTLCDGEGGGQAIPQLPDEDDKAFSARVLTLIADVPSETITALINAFSAIGKPASLEAIAKN